MPEIPFNAIEEVEEQQVVTVQKTVSKIVPVQICFDLTDRFTTGGIAAIRVDFRDSEDQFIKQQTYIVSGAFYAGILNGQVDPNLTQQGNFNNAFAAALLQIESDPALKQTLIDSGDLKIAPFRFMVHGG
jgi:hypothetical protein